MSKVSGDSDKVKEEKLTSAIEQVLWSKAKGAPGGKVALDIFTQLVGNNTEASIQLSDKSGKSFETIKKKLFGNKYRVELTIPEKAKDELYAEVKISKLSLTKKSAALNLLPQIEIKNLKWDKDEVHRGDILKITADISGAYDGAEAEVQIWEFDSDQAHDLVTSIPVNVKNKKIETEWEFQYVDDTDDIATDEENENGYSWPEYFFRIVVGGKSEDSKVIKFKDWVEIEWRYPNGEPAANKNFKMYLADGSEVSGTFDDDGKYRLEYSSPGPVRVSLEEEDENEDSDNEEEKQTIKINLKDAENNSYSNKKFEIRYGLDTVGGNTSGDGLIEAEIPADITEADLLVWLKDGEEKATYKTTLRFESIEPETDTKGIQTRLQSLGFYNGEIDGALNPMLRDAIKNFQKQNNLPVNGDLSSDLADKVNKKFKTLNTKK
ncbi:MAG: peptidoglycan-binding protein [Ignavibacteriales bacterium]|nr:MAG: peptidoglycan-binding protein [Ignavibacteriales bacterium]